MGKREGGWGRGRKGDRNEKEKVKVLGPMLFSRAASAHIGQLSP